MKNSDMNKHLIDDLKNKANQLMDALGNLPNGYLYQQMVETVIKMTVEPIDRGELKLLSTSLKELQYAFKIFDPYRSIRRASMFGSARTAPDHPDYRIAKETGRLLAENGIMVITGASGGIMAAGNIGAGFDASFGCNIRLPHEQLPNEALVDNPRLINFKYFFTRKVTFVKESHAVILLPGGFGTLDEGLETLTLLQTGKSDLKPLILLEHEGGTYWSQWRTFVQNELLSTGKISPDDVHLFSFHTEAETAVTEILNFYKMYYASRYAGDDFIIYCNRALSPDELELLNNDFRDILETGTFHQAMEPLEIEKDDEIIPDLPRLVFRFDKMSYGRLRQLINTLNGFVN